MRGILSCLFVALIATSTFAQDVAEEDGVYVLTSNNFDDFINTNEFVLVEFYAPWCGHCQRLAPEYSRAAERLRNENSNIKLAKVDTTVEQSLGGRFEIRGFPTLKFFINGRDIPYEGGRTEGEIVGWLNRKTQPSTLHIDTLEEFENLIRDNDLVVTFFGDKSHSDFAQFELVSRAFDDIIFIYTTNQDIKSNHEFDRNDVVTLFKRFDERVVDFDDEITVESLNQFIKNNQFPIVMGFDQKVAQKIFTDSRPAIFVMVQNDEAGQRAIEAFRVAAPKIKEHFYLSIANIDEGLGGRLAEFIGVSREQLPTIRLIKPLPGAAPEKYLFELEITPENIIEYAEAYRSGNLRSYLKSEPIPESQDGPVYIVVGNSFEDVVINNDNDVLIEFYAPWCGHCKALAPAYDEAGRRTENVKNLVIAKMDATVNEVTSVQLQSYPTIKFYPSGSKHNPIDFDGDRSADGIINWLKDHTVAAKWVDEDL